MVVANYGSRIDNSGRMVVQESRKRKLRVGLDFDGVVAYNPARIIRAPVKWFKREVLGIKKLSFFVPKNWWQRLAWTAVHESSIWPATGIELLKKMVNEGRIEVHLITGRFNLLEANTNAWLEKNGLTSYFKTVNINLKCAQPHLFKQKIVTKLKLDYYVEDNLDIVLYLQNKVKAHVFWIYNFMDMRHPYPDKFPYLKKALMALPVK